MSKANTWFSLQLTDHCCPVVCWECLSSSIPNTVLSPTAIPHSCSLPPPCQRLAWHPRYWYCDDRGTAFVAAPPSPPSLGLQPPTLAFPSFPCRFHLPLTAYQIFLVLFHNRCPPATQWRTLPPCRPPASLPPRYFVHDSSNYPLFISIRHHSKDRLV